MGSQKTTPLVAVLMGSKSDWDIMKEAVSLLKEFGVDYDVRVLSAHRTPAELLAHIEKLENSGVSAYIAAAGMAAHLGGVVAAHTIKPVIGVPIDSGSLQGIDALLSMVQMPPGIPVATMGIGKPGAKNSALFIVSILANQYPELSTKLVHYRKAQAEKVLGESLELP